MTTNRLFQSNLYGNREQTLIEDLIIECIQIYGLDVFYIPRTYVALDRLYGEDVLSAFNKSYTIEMYVESFQKYEGQGDLFSKFGIQVRDEMKMCVARRRFSEEVTADSPEIIRPEEGDLVWFPLDGALFEVSFNEDKELFFQAGKLYIYELTLKRFEFSGEQMNTGEPDVDGVEAGFGFHETIVFASGTGDFSVGEEAFQGTDIPSATFRGRVVSWDATSKTLVVDRVFGEIAENTHVLGENSGANYLFETVTVDSLIPNSDDPRVDNENLNTESDPVVDTTETNPLASY